MTEEFIYLILEHAPGVELQEYVKSNKINGILVKSLMKQLLSAIAHLHEQYICHKDIKPENIIFDKSNNTIKIIDFNISQSF